MMLLPLLVASFLFPHSIEVCALFSPTRGIRNRRFLCQLKGDSQQDAFKDVAHAVEVAFEDVRSSEFKGERSALTGSPEDDAIKKKVAEALGVDADGRGFSTSSQTLKKVQELSEEAGIAFIKARDYLDYLKISFEDRVERDVALLSATVEFVRQRSFVDTRRVLAAAADATRPLVLLAEATSDPSKRINLTLSEGLALLQSGVSPLQSARRLETFRFNEDEELRLQAAAEKKLLSPPSSSSATPIAPPLSLSGKKGFSVVSFTAGATGVATRAAAEAAVSLPFAAASAASAVTDVGYRARRMAGDRAVGDTALEGLLKLPLLPDGLRRGAIGLLENQVAKNKLDKQLPSAQELDTEHSGHSLDPSPEMRTSDRRGRSSTLQAEREEAEKKQQRQLLRDEAESIIRDRELSGITATAAAAVASTEEANEAEMLSRMKAALESCKALRRGNEWGRNATREKGVVRSLRSVLDDTQQADVREELQQALKEREAFIRSAGLLFELEHALLREVQHTSVRLRATAEIARRAASLATKVTQVVATSSDDGDAIDKTLQKLSLAARDIIPKVERRSQDNVRGRAKTAVRVGALRSQLASDVRACQPLVSNERTAAVVSMLVDVAKVESVVETAVEMAEGSERVREYALSLEALRATGPAEVEIIAAATATATTTATAAAATAATIITNTTVTTTASTDNPPLDASTETVPTPIHAAETTDFLEVVACSVIPTAEEPSGEDVSAYVATAAAASATTVVAQEPREWVSLSSTLPRLGVDATSKQTRSQLATTEVVHDATVIDVDEAKVDEAPKELNWGTLLLRFLDLGFFVGEEVFKLVAAATPTVSEALSTAADRAVKSLGDGTTSGPSGLKSFQRIEEGCTQENRGKRFLSGRSTKTPGSLSAAGDPTI